MIGKYQLLAGVFAVLLAPMASAQLVTEWNWDATKVGNQNWQDGANWPNQAGFPNDPGRVDGDDTVISPVVGANLSVSLGGNLTVNVGATDVTVASLRLGGTSGAVTTTVAGGSGGRLVFENFEQNFTPVPPEDEPEMVQDYAFNEGRALIISGGVPGSTNVISAPIFINKETLDIDSNRDANAPVGFVSTNNLLISGPITYVGGAGSSGQTPELNNYLPAGLTLTLSSPLDIADTNPNGDDSVTDFRINGSISNGGRTVITGVISGGGNLGIGNTSTSEVLPLSTVVLSAANTVTGRIANNRANIVLANNLAFGAASLKSKTNTGEFGNNLLSDNDSRNIANQMILSQFVTIKGDNALEWSGQVSQSNSRGWINLLPAGKEFKLSGTQFIDGNISPDLGGLPAADIPYAFDGSGLTRVTGAIRNHQTATVSRSIAKYGSGAAYLQGSLTANNSDYTYRTIVSGGNLHAATLVDLGTSDIVSRGGAIGLENGTVTGPDASSFFSRISNRATAPTTPIIDLNAFIVTGNDFANFDVWDHGGLMLAAGEYGGNLDFTSGNLVSAQDMSLAARDRGTTTNYTGTITPANATYRLGGGGGVLQLPNANQLTGARSLVVQNGLDFGELQQVGMVRLSSTNNYTGVTRIEGEVLASNEANGIADNAVEATNQYRGTTLAVTNLANGGVASSIGSSSSSASNLVIQGGTLRYEGAATSTDRLLTIGTRGGALDASGSGAVTFSNTGAIAFAIAAGRTGDVAGGGSVGGAGLVADIQAGTSDLVPGMTIAGAGLIENPNEPDDDTTITITQIISPTRIAVSDPINGSGVVNNSALTFGTLPRTLTLKGSNTGSNTIASVIGDDATTGNVLVSKEGAGKWVLTNAGNNWAGDTLVKGGTLSITNPTLHDTADVLLSSGAIFDLSFGGTDTIGGLFFDGAQQMSGTWGSLVSSAANKRDWFTGMGILNVTETVMVGDLMGDFNRDGFVDAADYTTWRDNLGAATEAALNGNGNGVGGVDIDDYNVWKMNFGMTAPPAGLGALGTVGGQVPEPSTIALLLLATLSIARMRTTHAG